MKVINLNGRDCCLHALIDTGSPISFVRANVYKRFFERAAETLRSPSSEYTALNNTVISIAGTVKSFICFEQLPDSVLEIQLKISEKDDYSNDLIIGRDFLNNRNISVLYKPMEKKNINEELIAFPYATM